MPSDPTTRAELKATLAGRLNRDDLTATEIPEAIVLVYGLAYAVGTWAAWPRFSAPRSG